MMDQELEPDDADFIPPRPPVRYMPPDGPSLGSVWDCGPESRYAQTMARPGMPSYNALGLDLVDGTWERLRAAAGATVDATTAADILGVKPATLRVWAHRGKIKVDHYERASNDFQGGTGQSSAMYRLADVLSLAASRRAG